MFSLSDRQQSLVIAVLLAAVAFKAARLWQDASREGAEDQAFPPSHAPR